MVSESYSELESLSSDSSELESYSSLKEVGSWESARHSASISAETPGDKRPIVVVSWPTHSLSESESIDGKLRSDEDPLPAGVDTPLDEDEALYLLIVLEGSSIALLKSERASFFNL